MTTLYQILTLLLEPFLWLYLRLRLMKGKEDKARFAERFGYAAMKRPMGKLVWVHAASVGESLSVLPLLERLTARHPDITLLLTTVTVTSAKLMESRLPVRSLHQFLPVDGIRPVRRFLKHWKPDLALWVESELWPNLLLETRRHNCPMLLLNGRISERSYENWQRYQSLARTLLPCFDLILAQNDRIARRFERLGARETRCLGNLKYDAPALPVQQDALAALSRAIGARKVWLAASTHPGEEKLVLEAHNALRATFPDLLTVIAPRHPAEGPRIRQLAEAAGISTAQRARGEVLMPETALYIADTLGELGLFFSLSPVVFMGGSLVPQGGHNPLEAARFGCAILTGPYLHHFTEIFAELDQAGGLVRVADVAELAQATTQLLEDPGLRQKLAKGAAEAVATHQGVLDRVLDVLDPYLKVRDS